jgi:hypothetical protein
MSKKTLSAIGTASHGVARTPSKGQKSFNTLIGKIEKRRAALADWEAFDTDFRQKYNDEFMPLQHSFDAVRMQVVHRLDQSHDIKGLTKAERQTVADLISYIAGSLLAHVEDPGMAEIYQRYNVPDPEAESAALEDMRQTMQAMFGVDIPDNVDLVSPDDVLRHVHEQLDQQDERERIHREARDEYHAKRKKTSKREAAEERARAEQAEVHLSVREVYRKLASALHPDREADPVERERKAVLMQRVNKAYGSKSLLDLLEIQLALEHIDQATLDSVSEDRLKRWNTVLKEQLRGLDQELMEVEIGFQASCGMSPALTVSPKTVKRALTTNISHLREGIRAFEKDLRVFDDVNRLKLWLKSMKRELAALQYDDMLF